NETTPTSNSGNKKKNNFASAKFRGMGCTASASQQVSVPAVVEEKVERRKEDMVDLHRVDWIMDGICGFGLGGSVSEMGWWNWLLGLLHFFSSPIDEASAARKGMISIHSLRDIAKASVFCVYGWIWES
ncbi:MAG: hypothetical protein O7C59_05895, partial [Rickettsia endosymbiont of Ixodes persulcatus]|nr:hypothetical protein [Rickettsia endosymbiont of Ixodes persulcatus]